MSLTRQESSELWLLIVSALNARGLAAAAPTPEERVRLDAVYMAAVDALLARLNSLEVES